MRVLLTGANGQLGQHLRDCVPAGVELLRSARRDSDLDCDLEDFDAVRLMLDQQRPDVVLNAAAWTAVDAAEDQPARASRLNAELPAVLAGWCRDHDAGLLTYSTDYVFSGQPGRAWQENDPTSPQSVYGRGKLDGELAVSATGARALMVRTAWVYSSGPGNFLSAILARAAQRQPLRVVADQIGSPTWAGELARASWVLVERTLGKLEAVERVHVSGRGAWSWHRFAAAAVKKAAERGLIPEVVNVAPISSEEWPQKARRPAWSVLDCSRYQALTGDTLMDVEQALDACLDQWSKALC